MSVTKTHPIKMAGMHGIALLESEIRDLLAQANHVKFLKRKKIKLKILKIIAEKSCCITAAYALVGLTAHGRMRESLKKDRVFQRQVSLIIKKRLEAKKKIIIDFLKAGLTEARAKTQVDPDAIIDREKYGFIGACKAVGISVWTGLNWRDKDYDFDMECSKYIE